MVGLSWRNRGRRCSRQRRLRGRGRRGHKGSVRFRLGLFFSALNRFQDIAWLGHTRPVDLRLGLVVAPRRGTTVSAASVKASRMALLFTSNSRAKSLIRTLLIRPFFVQLARVRFSSQPHGWGIDNWSYYPLKTWNVRPPKTGQRRIYTPSSSAPPSPAWDSSSSRDSFSASLWLVSC
jgi:hypothetical protein